MTKLHLAIDVSDHISELERFGLSYRVIGTLEANRITTICDLLYYRRHELLLLTNIAEDTADEIVRACRELVKERRNEE